MEISSSIPLTKSLGNMIFWIRVQHGIHHSPHGLLICSLKIWILQIFLDLLVTDSFCGEKRGLLSEHHLMLSENLSILLGVNLKEYYYLNGLSINRCGKLLLWFLSDFRVRLPWVTASVSSSLLLFDMSDFKIPNNDGSSVFTLYFLILLSHLFSV